MLKKVDVRQRDIKDCGAASLLSIIKYYDGYVPLEKIRQDTALSKSGITAYNLILAARKYGFDAKGIKATAEDLLSGQLLLPAIAYVTLSNGLNHYVVIYKVNKKNITIMDPAKGIKAIKLDDFYKIWQNIIIVLYPRSEIVKYEENNKLFDLIIKVFAGERKLLFYLIITSILLTIFSIAGSFYMKFAITAAGNSLTNMLIFIAIIFLIFCILKAIMTYLRNYYSNYLNKNIDAKIIVPFIKHIFNLPLKAMSNYTTGEIMTRVNELNNIKNLFSELIISFGLNMLLAITSMIVLYNICSKLSLALFMVIAIYILFNLCFLKLIEHQVNRNIVTETNANAIINSYVSGFASIKNINKLDFFHNNIEINIIKYLKENFKLNNIINHFTFGNDFIIEIGLFITNTLGLYMILNNSLELIDLITFDSLYLYLIDPIKQIINLIPKYYLIKNSFAKINDFILLKEEDLSEVSNDFYNGDINIYNTSFTYDYYQYPLQNFNLKINKGNKVLITGTSGCGKSTLFKLIYRLYEPKTGEIRINDINIKDYKLKVLRDNITYVSQDEMIFTDSLKNNITLGQDIGVNILNEVIKICQVDNIINKKGLRLDSFILENGENLSGGEKARIILARSLLKESSIILIDETFAQIEESDANKIINSIMKKYKDKTILLISHFIPDYSFDQVVRMKDYE
jgi:ATP-binding cassette subfamily B protein